MKNNDWVGFDLDGTLSHEGKWRGIGYIGKPVKPMIKLLKKYLSKGITVKIFTARWHGGKKARYIIEKWCKKHIGWKLEITAVKDYNMLLLYDNRAVGVIKNTGRIKTNGRR
jgi:hypothetical protein